MANIVYMARSAWTGLLDTIRSKAGITGSMTVSQATDAVDSIETGGGGNIAKVNFKGESAGAIDATLPYSGNGYPICVCIYPKGGAEQAGISDIVSQNGVAALTMIKNDVAVAPSYSAAVANDKALSVFRYKQNNTSATRYLATPLTVTSYSNSNAASGTSAFCKIKNKNTISVYIKDNSTTEYGFLSGIDYTCQVIYSE